MKAPKVDDSLLWGRRKRQHMEEKGFIGHGDKAHVHSFDVSTPKPHQQPLSANQLAAKAMQLRLKGKHDEAETILKEAENAKADQRKGERLMKLQNDVRASSYVAQDMTMRQKWKEDDIDIHLAESIMKNKQCSMSTQADDEYDYDGGPTKKRRKEAESNNRSDTQQDLGKRIQTQQERCMYCFENPKRPKHLAIDDAEDEWSQHDAKKLIEMSRKGLRSSIPKNFPYFHVEFGLSRGFVHVIDDERRFQSSLGLNVVRGMLQGQDEDMYHRRRYESIEVQREAVAAFCKNWEPFDWTKQLH